MIALAVAALLIAQSGDLPPDSPFAAILWLHGGPERDDAFWRTVQDLGFDAVNVTTGGDAAEPSRHGMRFYLDQLVPKGLLELRDHEWQPIQRHYEEHRDARALIRPSCLSAVEPRVAVETAVVTALGGARKYAPIAAALGDEVSLTRHADPLDLCFSESCLRGFRQFLRRRYGDLGTLNANWGTTYESFEDVRPWTADQIRARELVTARFPQDLRPWAEHLEFRDGLLTEVVAGAVERGRSVTENVPLGLTGIQAPSAYGGHDYGRLLSKLSFYEVYDTGGARDLAMSLVAPDALQMVTLFAPKPHEPRRLVEARVFDAIAHGMSGVIAWSAGTVVDDAGEPTKFGAALRSSLRAVRPAIAAFAGATVRRSRVWLVESQPAVRVHWMLDSRADRDTWVRRLSSHEATHSTSLAARASWTRLLEDLGYQGLWVSSSDLAQRLQRGPRPKVLVLPACIALADSAVAAVSEFARGGGTIVADHSPALYDERARRRSVPGLDAVFGVTGRDWKLDSLCVSQGRSIRAARLRTGAAAAEKRIRGDVAEPSGEFHVQIERRVRAGRATYLNLAVCEYAAARLDPGRVKTARDLRLRVRRVFEDAGLLPPVDVRGEGLPTCIERIRLRSRDGRELLAVRLNALDDSHLCRLLGDRGARRVTLTFPRSVGLRNVLTGRAMGVSDRFEVTLDPWRAALFELEEPR